jgi:ribonuclease BN (tRNA processing enzyme)
MEDDQFSVLAAPLQHTIPCLGFVVVEKDRPGRLKIEHVEPIVDKHMVL